jgi:hypothetical protein
LDAGILWRYLPNENTWENGASLLRLAYPQLTTRLAAGAYNSDAKQIVFFTSKDVYRYDIDHRNQVKFRNEQSLPRNLRNSIVGAIYYRNAIHIITGQTIRLFQLDKNYAQSDEQDLSEEFPRFTGTVKKAFSYQGLHHFFTNDHLVYVWNERSNRWQTFGKPMETSWFACSGAKTYTRESSEVRRPAKHTEHRGSHHHHRHHHHHHHHD